MEPIPRVDPVKQKNLAMKTMEGAVATPPGTWFFKNVVSHFEPAMIRASGGKLQFGNGPRVNVTAPGRKSGEPRTATLLYFTRDDEVILIASNFGGEHLPAWYYNVMAARGAELQWRGGGGHFVAREADEPERTALFELAKKLYGGYGNYAKKTAGIRKIPVLILTPAP